MGKGLVCGQGSVIFHFPLRSVSIHSAGVFSFSRRFDVFILIRLS